MTMFSIQLVSLEDQDLEVLEKLEKTQETWTAQLEKLRELEGIGGWELMERLRGHPKIKLDWGAFLYPLNLDQLQDLYIPASEK